MLTRSPDGEKKPLRYKDLESRHDQNPSLDADIALAYVGLGDQDQAISWLNKGYEARFKASILLRPAFDPLRSGA
jgi:uncharacterized protein HemY